MKNIAFTLTACDYNTPWIDFEVSVKELSEANVGDGWHHNAGTCERARFYEIAEVVSKNEKSVTVEFTSVDESYDFPTSVTTTTETVQKIVFSLPNCLETVRYAEKVTVYDDSDDDIDEDENICFDNISA